MHPFIEDLQTLKAFSKRFVDEVYLQKEASYVRGKKNIPVIPGQEEFIVNSEGLDNLSNGEYKSHMFCIVLS